MGFVFVGMGLGSQNPAGLCPLPTLLLPEERVRDRRLGKEGDDPQRHREQLASACRDLRQTPGGLLLPV